MTPQDREDELLRSMRGLYDAMAKVSEMIREAEDREIEDRLRRILDAAQLDLEMIALDLAEVRVALGKDTAPEVAF